VEICRCLPFWMRSMSLKRVRLMAHVFPYRKNCQRTNVRSLQQHDTERGKLSMPFASSLFFYKTLAMARTHDLFLAP
jgi:hypothetical protein